MISRLVFFDLETGGLDKDKHPIIQLAAIAVDARTWEELETFEALLHFDERGADPRALALNHYDPERWKREGISAGEAMNKFSLLLKRHAVVGMTSKSSGRPYKVAKLAGHNAASFDGPFLAAWYKREGEYLPADPRVLCTMQLASWLALDADPAPKSFKLADLCAHHDLELSKAHDALSDVRATVALARYLTGGGQDEAAQEPAP